MTAVGIRTTSGHHNAMNLSVHAITKSFGPVVANDNVSFAIASGEVVGLVGENGAGKSTILSILGGMLQPDSGSIAIDGTTVSFPSPGAARTAGIGFVHQHRTLVPTFTVHEQLRLAGWDGRRTPELLESRIDLHSRIEQLSPGEQQRVEIARELLPGQRLLLLDEPTSVLAPSEVDSLFAAIRRIRDQGTPVVIVSHKLHEILAIADRIVVLARGRVQGAFSRPGSGWSEDVADQVLAAMFPDRQAAEPETLIDRLGVVNVGDPTLMARGLVRSSPDAGPPLRGIDLDLVPGMIQSIVGVDGQGQELLAEVLAGYRSASGSIELDGASIGVLPAIERARRGMSLMSGNRTGVATIPAMTVSENLILKRPRHSNVAGRFALRRSGIRAEAQTAIAAWDIRPPNPEAPLATLSGGNMQRVIAARDIPRGSRVLIAVNPVHGLDVRTTEVMWQRLRDHAASGAAVLVFVSDIDEALAQSDRIAVMFNGTVSEMLPTRKWTRTGIASRMVGA
ncbi:MAG TPA: ATP-binding cassette domain-containing protein [Thermomicrobiales bacterium]|nr:ATP-binding cassette domain-containing protein [Thermomicrobiales bacterium]